MGFKEARVRAGKKVSDVMEHMGVSDAAIYMWENGTTVPRGQKLARLAEFYGCSIDDLLKKEAETENND